MSWAVDIMSTSVAPRALFSKEAPTASAPCSVPENRVEARATLRKRARKRPLPLEILFTA